MDYYKMYVPRILKALDSINDKKEKVKFLREEIFRFRRDNDNREANGVIQYFEGLLADIREDTGLEPKFKSDKLGSGVIKQEQPNDAGITIKTIIEKEFETLSEQGWEYAFFKKNDYELFVDILVNFFIGKVGQPPYDPIRLKRRTKNKIASVLRDIYYRLRETSLRSDKDYFDALRVLLPFKDQGDDKIYKSLTRN